MGEGWGGVVLWNKEFREGLNEKIVTVPWLEKRRNGNMWTRGGRDWQVSVSWVGSMVENGGKSKFPAKAEKNE